MSEVDIRGLRQRFPWEPSVSRSESVSYGPIVNTTIDASCAGAVDYGSLSRYRMILDPSQYDYEYCTCVAGFFGDISRDAPWYRPCVRCPAVGADAAGATATCEGGVLSVEGGAVTLDGDLAVQVVSCPSDGGSGDGPCVTTTVANTPPFLDDSLGNGTSTAESVAAVVDAWLSSDDGNVRTTCRDGYEGRLCSRCSAGHYASGRTCKRCSAGTWWLKPVVSVVVLIALALRVIRGGAVARSGLFRTLTLHVQLFAALPSRSLLLPAAIRSTFSASEDALYAPFVLAVCAPLVVAVGSVLTVAVGRATKTAVALSLKSSARVAFGYLWLLLMFASVRRVLSVLSCTTYGDSASRAYVTTALWERCDRSPGTAYSALFGFGTVTGLAFIVATVAMVSIPLRRLKAGSPAEEMWENSPWAAYLIAPYDDGNRWWDTVQVGKKLAIAALQALSPFRSSVLPVGITLLLTGSLSAQAWRKPFRSRVDNLAESLSAALLLVTYMGGLVVSNGAFASRGTEGVAWLAVVLNALFVAGLVVFLAVRVAGKRSRLAKFGRLFRGSEDTLGEELSGGSMETAAMMGRDTHAHTEPLL